MRPPSLFNRGNMTETLSGQQDCLVPLGRLPHTSNASYGEESQIRLRSFFNPLRCVGSANLAGWLSMNSSSIAESTSVRAAIQLKPFRVILFGRLRKRYNDMCPHNFCAS